MSTAEPPVLPSPRRRPWRRLVLVGVLLLLALGVLAALYLPGRRDDQELREVIADTDRRDPGWRFDDLEVKRTPVPDDKNGALKVLAARALLPAQWPAAPAEGESVEKLLDDLQPQEQLSAEQLRALRAQLQAVQPALKEAEGLADLPTGRYPIVWNVQFISSNTEVVQQGRAVSRLLQLEAMRRAQEGDADGACRLELPLLNTARSVGDEYTLLIHLVRTSLAAAAARALERTLAQGEPAEASLAPVQALLEREEEETPALAVAAFRGERALAHRMLDAVERGELSLSAMSSTPSFGERVGDWLNAGTVRHSHVVYLRSMSEAVELAKRPGPAELARCKKLLGEMDRNVRTDRKAWLAGMLMVSADKLLETESRKLAQLRCAIAAVALERYRRAEGRWPESLEALAPRYLSRVPTDPFDGRPLRYHRLDDGVVVYSVGPDQTDDGGHLDRKDPLAAGNDLGFRLWDMAHRRQPVLPPAEEK